MTAGNNAMSHARGRGGLVASTRTLLWVIRLIENTSLGIFEGYIISHRAGFDSHQPSCLELLKNLCPMVRSYLAIIRLAALTLTSVRLGNSGLKVSKIILGCMSYGKPPAVLVVFGAWRTQDYKGDPGWQSWVLSEKEGIDHIKAAYVLVVLC